MSLKRRKRKSDTSTMLTAREMREKYLKEVDELREKQGLEPFLPKVDEESEKESPVLLKPVPVKKAKETAGEVGALAVSRLAQKRQKR